MKRITILLAAMLLVNCHSQKKLEFEVPTGSPPEVAKLYEEQFKKGKALYKLHCGECHGIYSRGKDNVPNFTDSQIHVYTIKVLGKSDDHGIMKKMSVEQFTCVMNFLSLRNPSVARK